MTYSEIEKQFSELSDRIDTLQALYEQINNFVIQHFVLFWAIIVGVFAIIGVALYFIAKSVAQKGVDKAIYDFNMRINKLETQINGISENSNPPQEFELPLSAGVHTAPNLKSTYCKASNTLVIVTIQSKSMTQRHKPYNKLLHSPRVFVLLKLLFARMASSK